MSFSTVTRRDKIYPDLHPLVKDEPQLHAKLEQIISKAKQASNVDRDFVECHKQLTQAHLLLWNAYEKAISKTRVKLLDKSLPLQQRQELETTLDVMISLKSHHEEFAGKLEKSAINAEYTRAGLPPLYGKGSPSEMFEGKWYGVKS